MIYRGYYNIVNFNFIVVNYQTLVDGCGPQNSEFSKSIETIWG